MTRPEALAKAFEIRSTLKGYKKGMSHHDLSSDLNYLADVLMAISATDQTTKGETKATSGDGA